MSNELKIVRFSKYSIEHRDNKILPINTKTWDGLSYKNTILNNMIKALLQKDYSNFYYPRKSIFKPWMKHKLKNILKKLLIMRQNNDTSYFLLLSNIPYSVPINIQYFDIINILYNWMDCEI